MFDKVQEKLSANDPKNENNRHQSQGLLRGLVFNENGTAYSPSYSQRKGKKPGQDKFFRYYTSQRAIKEGYDYPGIKNIRMEDLDSLVIAHLRKSLPQSLFKGWEKTPLQEKRVIIRQHIDRIVIHEGKIDICRKTEDGTKTHSIPMQYRKYGGRKLMLDANGKDILPASSDKDPALIKALVRAHRWERKFRRSDDIHLMNIVKTEKLGNRYVEKIYRLKFLSPQVKEAILDGTQPRTLTLSRLMSDIPLCWQEQARVFGL